MRLVIAGCFAIALVSLALPAAPATDPWAWLVWGRELAAFELSTGGGSVVSSWKPLPVLITAMSSPFGDLAPELWLVLVRAGSLLALALAYRLGARLAGPVGGVVTSLGLLLTPGWVGLSSTGYSEPLLAALTLWAVERHLDGHRGQAFFLGFLVALGRPEASLLLVLYGVLAWRREPRKLPVVLAAGAALLLLWFGVDWLASGSPVTGIGRAGGSERSTLENLARPLSLVLAPVWLLALAGVVMAARDANTAGGFSDLRRLPSEARFTLVLGAGALAWIAIVVLMILLGYSALPRFMLPAGAALCVVAGVGAARLLKVVTAWRASVPVLVGLSLVVLPFAIARIALLPERAADTREHATSVGDVQRAVQAAGGPERLLACGSIGSVDPRTQGALAWELGVPLDDVEVIPTGASGRLDVSVLVARNRPTALEVLPSGAAGGQRPRLERFGGSGTWSVFATDCPPEALTP